MESLDIHYDSIVVPTMIVRWEGELLELTSTPEDCSRVSVGKSVTFIIENRRFTAHVIRREAQTLYLFVPFKSRDQLFVEKRSNPRIAVELPAKIQNHIVPAQFEPLVVSDISVINLTTTGIGFIAPEQFSIGRPYYATLQDPSLSITFRVSLTNLSSDSRGIRHGGEITSIDPDDLAKFRRFILLKQMGNS